MSREEAREPIIHRDLAVVEASCAALLDRLYQEPSVRPLLWFRLDETRVVVASHQLAPLTKALANAGLPAHYSRKL